MNHSDGWKETKAEPGQGTSQSEEEGTQSTETKDGQTTEEGKEIPTD